MELQGFAVTTFWEQMNFSTEKSTADFYRANMSAITYQPDFLDIGVPPLKHHEEELVGLLAFLPLIIEFYNRRLGDKKESYQSPK